MSDYAGSDQAIRDIVAQLQGIPPAAPVQALPPQGVMPAPEVTPTMQYAQQPQQAAPAQRPAPDDWVPPTPSFVPPPVSPLGQMAALPRPAAPTMGQVLAAPSQPVTEYGSRPVKEMMARYGNDVTRWPYKQFQQP